MKTRITQNSCSATIIRYNKPLHSSFKLNYVSTPVISLVEVPVKIQDNYYCISSIMRNTISSLLPEVWNLLSILLNKRKIIESLEDYVLISPENINNPVFQHRRQKGNTIKIHSTNYIGLNNKKPLFS